MGDGEWRLVSGKLQENFGNPSGKLKESERTAREMLQENFRNVSGTFQESVPEASLQLIPGPTQYYPRNPSSTTILAQHEAYQVVHNPTQRIPPIVRSQLARVPASQTPTNAERLGHPEPSNQLPKNQEYR